MILNKRILRELRSNIFRYAALFLLLLMGMTVVIGLSAATDSITETVKSHAQKNNIEDGQFSLFVPFSDNNIKELSEKGIQLEQEAYLDFKLSNGSVLRIFKNRKNINLVELNEGKHALETKQIVLEEHYAEKYLYHVGDTISIGDNSCMISGIGTAPDYDSVLKNISDTSSDPSKFGISFVSDYEYEILKNSSALTSSEEISYSYKLNGDITAKDLKDYLCNMDFDKRTITDKYMKETIDKLEGRKVELTNGINSLTNGNVELSNGLGKLSENNNALTSATSKVFDAMLSKADSQLNLSLTKENYSEILGKNYDNLKSSSPQQANMIASIKTQLDNYAGFSKGLTEYTNGVSLARDNSVKLAEGAKKLQNNSNELINKYFDVKYQNLISFVQAEENPRIYASVNDAKINKVSALFFGVIYLIMMAYIISVFIVHNIESESAVIGTLYSLGYQKRDLMKHFLILPILVIATGGIAGTSLGLALIEKLSADNTSAFSYPKLDIIVSPYIIGYGVVLPVIIAVIVNLIVINRKLSQAPLKLLRKEKKASKISDIDLGNIGFINRFRIRQILREIRGNISLFAGLSLAILIMVFGVLVYASISNIANDLNKDVKFHYMYVMKFPTQDVPKMSEECYTESLYAYCKYSKSDIGVIIQGINPHNPYYDFKVDKKAAANELYVSSSAAKKFGWKKGDKIILSSHIESKDYAFTVKEVVQYGNGLYAFMNIGSMRTLFEKDDTYYNTLLSDNPLIIESGRLAAVTTLEDIKHTGEIFMKQNLGAIILVMIISVILFVIVMFLLLKIMIDKATFSISLIKVFGYTEREVRKLYLGSNLYIVLITAIIAMPVSKFIMDILFPYMVSNIPAGLDTTFGIIHYAAIAIIIFGSYFLANYMLGKHLKKISLVEILKARE